MQLPNKANCCTNCLQTQYRYNFLCYHFSFLDQYYQQFDQRVQPSLERSDASSFDDDPLSAAASVSQDDVAADVEEVAARAKSFPDSLADGSANIYSQLSSPGLGAPTHSLPSSPYLRPVPLPAQQYSSGLSSLPSLGGAALGGLGGQPDSVVSFPSTLDSDYAPSLSSSSSSGDGTYKRTFSLPGHSSSSSGYGAPESNFIDDGYKEVPYTSKPLASKYFGVATTTSQDIQARKQIQRSNCLRKIFPYARMIRKKAAWPSHRKTFLQSANCHGRQKAAAKTPTIL